MANLEQFLITMNKWKLRRDKRIGQVVFIVEGESEEPKIFHKIFHEILGYTCQIKRKKDKAFEEYRGHDSDSMVRIINANSNNMKLLNTQDFYDYILELEKQFDINIKNTSTYFVFDRDPKNNKLHLVNHLAKELSSAQNDGDGVNGLLLLSYPCVEALLLNGTQTDSHLLTSALGKDLKKTVAEKKLKIEHIDEAFLFRAANELEQFLKKVCHLDLQEIDFDNFGAQHQHIIHCQQEHYKKHNTFFVISEVLLALLDLGILSYETAFAA